MSHTTNNVNTASGSTGSSNPLMAAMQLSSGAGAELLDMLHAELQMQTQMMAYAGELEAANFNVNASVAQEENSAYQSSAEADQASQTAAAWGTLSQAISSGASSGFQIGCLGYGYARPVSAQTQLNLMRSYQTELTKAKPAGATISTTNPDGSITEGGLTVSGDEVNNIRAALQSHNFDMENVAGATPDKVKLVLRNTANIAEKSEIAKGLETRINTLSNDVATAQKQRDDFINFGRTLFDMGGSVGSGVMQIKSANEKPIQAEYDGIKAMAQNSVSIAAQTASTLDSKIKSELDAAIAACNVYSQSAAVSARG